MPTPPGIDKAARLLNNLPSEVLDRVLERLGPERSARVRERMEALSGDGMGPAELGTLVSEFEDLLAQPSTVTAVATGPQLALYRRAAEQVADDPGDPEDRPVAKAEEVPVEAEGLAGLAPEVLAAVLLGEPTQIVAMVLNSIPAARAGAVLARLPAELRRDVPVCLSRQGAFNPALLERITKALLQKARSAGQTPGADGPSARYEKIASMLRSLEKADRNEALAALQEQEPDAAAQVKDLLYQFEDLLRIVDRSMQKLLSEIDTKSLALALKNAPEEITEKVLGNLSLRAREALGEEMELLGPVPAAQTRQAQKTVVEVIQRLDQLGELQMDE